MLDIVIPGSSDWDERAEEFVSYPEIKLQMEHSLVSMSKWESFYEKPFLTDVEKSPEEWLYYIKCMTVPDIYPMEVYYRLSDDNIDIIRKYIERPMSAFKVSDVGGRKSKRKSERVTAELLYYCIFSYNIPIECENWHLGRLRALLDMFASKNQKEEKLPMSEVYKRNRAINEANKAKYRTKG